MYLAYLRNVGLKEAKVVKDDVATAAKETTKRIDENNVKTDNLHGMLNSRLDEFKKMVEEKGQADAAANRKEFEALLALDREEFVKRIKALEQIIESQQKTIQSGPTIAPLTPDQRITEHIQP